MAENKVVHGQRRLPLITDMGLGAMAAFTFSMSILGETINLEGLLMTLIIVSAHILATIWFKNNSILMKEDCFVYHSFQQKIYIPYDQISEIHYLKKEYCNHHYLIRFIDKDGSLLVDVPSGIFTETLDETKFINDVLFRNSNIELTKETFTEAYKNSM